jgi:hypothetical protein
MEAFIHGIHWIVMEIIVVDVIPEGVEVKVDPVLVVFKNLVGVNVIIGGIVEADSFEKIVSDNITRHGVILIDTAVHPVLPIIGNDIVLDRVVGSNDHHPIISIFSDDIAVGDNASTAVLHFYPRVVVKVDLIV